jgi:amino acid adenylation domain-containing protein
VRANLRQQIAELSPEARARLELQLLKNVARAKQNRIARRSSSAYPLSVGQERLFFLYLLEPNSPAYNQPKALRITGDLNLGAMKRVLEAIVARHEALHSTFSLQDGIPAQSPNKDYSVKLPLFDLSDRPSEKRAAEAHRLSAEISQRPFNLSEDLMLRTALLRLSSTEHILLLVTHHIVSDGPSRDILFHEIASLYDAFSANKPSPLSELPIQYGDFALWQRESLKEAVLEEQFSYWRKQLEGVPTVLKLPTDRSRSTSQTFWGSSEMIVISQSATEKLKDLSRHHSATLFMTLLTAFQILLSRYTGQSSFLIGVPISGRRLPELQNLVGFFVSSLLLRADLSGDPTFSELLTRVRETALAAYAHPDIPFESLLQEFQPERDLSFHPMFQVMFALRSDFTKPITLSEITFTPMAVEIGTAKFDLTLTITERAHELAATFTYNSDLFDAATIRRMAAEFNTLVEGIVADPRRPVGKLPLLTKAERQQLLLECNGIKSNDPVDRCVQELFQEQASRTPDATAVIFENEWLSYRELDGRANQLAHRLQALGVGPGVLVGIYMERSLDMVTALLGILKAGGAYVPLDPNYPTERLTLILEDTQAPVLISQQRLIETLPKHGRKVICLDSEQEIFSQESKELPSAGVTGDSLAYVIYTSGSTGKPKGVEITHRALVNFTTSACTEFALGPNDRVLQFASISFDAAAEEIFPCLSRGATLVLRTDSMLDSVSLFLQRCRDWRITVVDLPTAYWHELTEKLYSEHLTLPDELRLTIIGGEKAAPERLAQWQKIVGDRLRLLNTYGPTETTVVATMWEPAESDRKDVPPRELPIGRPISNIQTYVLDRYLQPVPIGVGGELYIGGAGLARGYLNRPELTAEKFIPNPFSDEPGARLYRTGDLARYLPDGNIEFLGRIDHQVKIRGFRIELREIETVLGEIQGIREAVLVVHEDGVDKRLVAYVLPNQDSIPTSGELRSVLKSKLPDYMIPSTFVFLDALPLTSSGKIDRRALPAPDQTRPDLKETFVPPRTPEEKTIAEIWAEILKLEEVGIHDNFFDLGGHSLTAIRLASRISNAFHIDLPLRTVFEASTVASLAVQIAQLQTKRAASEDMADVLADLQSLSDEEAELLLGKEDGKKV